MALKVFRKFRGSGAWASRVLKITPVTVSQWLHGRITSARMDVELPRLAQMLLESDGECMLVNTASARAKVNRIRGAAKRKAK